MHEDRLHRELATAVAELRTAFIERNTDKVAALVTDNHVSIMSYARFDGRAQLLDHLNDYAFRSYVTDDLTTTPLGPEEALISFRSTLDGTYAGKPVPREVLVGEVWLRQDGNWREATYQETPL
ncbi:nuclear transport factor 2 family protein [Dactylosporangium sp. AC04546]|uniref:nuclear transport factor 2 family protein n=1 Tax=Dactylosporangium sp. AC04546 TaxID=2862460 RepID=UPI001EDF8964|nr:nuclear transport factor 2 family protein [Dactylosporangium sp. AC04546]WVK82932.1 nuclear transport factor 2 family protein [Dactylosporangium sp. AC04546]